ncbi:hypothetical protein SAY86_000367 [Trapa natans]|uniref:HECT domain-containing protein n=1 Tax=Trapa natans TaxID=22666 RepID=A0AAN7MAS9_TRANT|nr:hypothetical protein SAY86_000367 [Trapa natans]
MGRRQQLVRIVRASGIRILRISGIDFSVPGYPNYTLSSYANQSMVNMMNLDDYVSLVVDATVKTGISRQVEVFKSGFDEVFPIRHLQIFSEEELECLLCGEHDA